MVKLPRGDGETLTKPFQGRKVQKILRQNPKDEKESITGVGDDEIRKDGMCVSAGTGKPQDTEAVAYRITANEIDQGAVIVGMDATGPRSTTAGTDLKFRAKPAMKESKRDFDEDLIRISLQKREFSLIIVYVSDAKATGVGHDPGKGRHAGV